MIKKTHIPNFQYGKNTWPTKCLTEYNYCAISKKHNIYMPATLYRHFKTKERIKNIHDHVRNQQSGAVISERCVSWLKIANIHV